MTDYTPERLNDECGGCEYHLTEMDGTQTQNADGSDIIKSDQTCGRILKRKSDGNFTSEGCEECGGKSEAECNGHCEWKTRNDPDSGRENGVCVLGTIGGDCSLYGCHQKCQYPFRILEAYRPSLNLSIPDGESQLSFLPAIITIHDKLKQVSSLSTGDNYALTNNYYGNGNGFKILSSNGDIITTAAAPEGRELVTDIFSDNYGGLDDAPGKNCGPLVEAGENHIVKFPDPPDFEDFLEIVKNRMEITGEINWFAINPISYEQIIDPFPAPEDSNVVIMGEGTIPFSNNGISLQWWREGDTGDLVDTEDERFLQLGGEEAIIQKTFGSVEQNQLYKYLIDHPIDGYDFTRICQQQLRDADISNVLTPTEEDNFVFSFLLNVGPDAEQNRSFEKCMNRLMRTPGDNDSNMVQRVRQLSGISELGSNDNKTLLDYVERKIQKFLSLRTDQFDKCIEKIEISDNICIQGLFPNAMDMLSRILDMETGRTTADTEEEEEEDKVKVVSDRLLKYVPQLIKKILEISTTYENDYCGAVSPKTKLLQEIYDNLFKKEVTINIPELGLDGFFEDFGDYGIIGKVVLMLFFVYIFTQFMTLFKVNVAV